VANVEVAGKDVFVPSVYLNPGEVTLLLYVDTPGFALNTWSLPPLRTPRGVSGAVGIAARLVEVSEGCIQSLGRKGSGLTFVSTEAPAGRGFSACAIAMA